MSRIMSLKECEERHAKNLQVGVAALINRVNQHLNDNKRTISVEDHSDEAIAIVKKEIEIAGWSVKEEQGGDARNGYHNLVLSKPMNVRDYYAK